MTSAQESLVSIHNYVKKQGSIRMRSTGRLPLSMVLCFHPSLLCWHELQLHEQRSLNAGTIETYAELFIYQMGCLLVFAYMMYCSQPTRRTTIHWHMMTNQSSNTAHQVITHTADSSCHTSCVLCPRRILFSRHGELIERLISKSGTLTLLRVLNQVVKEGYGITTADWHSVETLINWTTVYKQLLPY